MTFQNLMKTAGAVAAAAVIGFSAGPVSAADLPGAGKTVIPGQDNVDGENFQTQIVIKALEALGYEIAPLKQAKYPALHLAVANGDATFLADNWNPLHDAFFKEAGGAAKLTRFEPYIPGCAQGYLIDKKTADKYNITNYGQFKDPKIAKLFDADGNGKADLAGCPPGWGCEKVIEHQIPAFGLEKTVQHNQGEYSAIISDTITRYKNGESVLYYTWTPYWVSGVLVPGKDVVWLEVPHSAHPNGPDADTTLPNGKNYGFYVNSQDIIANKKWVDANPAAKMLFSVMELPANDVSAENLVMKNGEGGWDAAGRHADAWIKANKATFDSWIKAAMAAAK